MTESEVVETPPAPPLWCGEPCVAEGPAVHVDFIGSRYVQ